MRKSVDRFAVLFFVFLLTGLFSKSATEAAPPQNKTGKIQDLFNQGGDNFGQFQNSQPKLTVEFNPETAYRDGVITLRVKLALPADNYTYPLKDKTGPTTRITIKKLTGLTAIDSDFTPIKPAKEVIDPVLKMALRKHIGGATWIRKYKVTNQADLQNISITGTIRYQVCTDEICKPPKTETIAAIAKIVEKPVAATSVKTPKKQTVKKTPQGSPLSSAFELTVIPERNKKPDPVTLQFKLFPKNAKPGEKVTVSITADFKDDWHAYALTHKLVEGGSGLPVTICMQAVNELEPIGKGWRPDKAPHVTADSSGKKLLEHPGKVTWSRQFKVADSAATDKFGLKGKICYQICDEGSKCKPPKSVTFSLGDLSNETPAPAGSDDIDDTPFPGGAGSEEAGSLAWFLLLSFLGGLILNIMPCVLPVIAIKVMSFVQQAGEDRKRILALNASYSLGVILVFLFLATLAVGIGTGGDKLGWGGLFQKDEFNVVMACVIFAMGLSLLGVFEIPIPGFIGSAAGGQHKEGLGGALLTGIFATLLATPCTGPFLGTTLAWSVKQTVPVTYLVWGLMGLGMAFPYLMLGMFPSLIRFLPKPGNWMVRFKEVAGFILMGTVIFFISFMSPKFVVPLLIMLMGVGVGMWMIGNLYDINSHIKHKTTVRVSALLVMGVLCGGGYSLTMESEHELPWEEFNDENLQTSLDKGQTVLVDFTADWCTNCKVNEKFALNRKATLDFVTKHNITPLVADYTKESPKIKAWLVKFKTDGVPLTVIFPANRPDEPIVLNGVFTNGTLLEKLQEAVNIPKKKAEAAGDKQAALP